MAIMVRNIEALDEEQRSQFTQIMKDAFSADPVTLWFLNKVKKDRTHAYDLFYDAIAKAAALNEGVLCEVGDFKGAAIWIAPGKTIDNPFTYFQSGLIPFLYHAGLSTFCKMVFSFSPKAEAAKKRASSNSRPTWYLQMLAVSPAFQGQGLTRVLLQPYIEKSDKDQVNLYLEATTIKSRDIYQRLGFVITEEIILGKGQTAATGEVLKGGPGVKIWAMVRQPAAILS